jgi:hypothetical protein
VGARLARPDADPANDEASTAALPCRTGHDHATPSAAALALAGQSIDISILLPPLISVEDVAIAAQESLTIGSAVQIGGVSDPTTVPRSIPSIRVGRCVWSVKTNRSAETKDVRDRRCRLPEACRGRARDEGHASSGSNPGGALNMGQLRHFGSLLHGRAFLYAVGSDEA